MKTTYLIPILSILAAGAAACAPDDGARADAPDGGSSPPSDAPCKTYYEDKDGDGYGDPKRFRTSCTAVPGSVESGDDCDDASKYVNPLEPEVCDGLDNDCKDKPAESLVCPPGCQPMVNPHTGNRYLFCSADVRQTWTVASSVCRAHQFHLVQIDDLEENEYVKNTATLLFGVVDQSDQLWLGGSDSDEGVWSWQSGVKFWHGLSSDSRTPGLPVASVYQNWAVSEPNNGGDGSGESCLTQSASGQWNDSPCTSKYAFVCERD